MDRDNRNENQKGSRQDWPKISGVPTQQRQKRQELEEPISFRKEKAQRRPSGNNRNTAGRSGTKSARDRQTEGQNNRDNRYRNSRAYQMRMERERAEEAALRRSYMRQWLWMGIGVLVLAVALIIILVSVLSQDKAIPIETPDTGNIVEQSQQQQQQSQQQQQQSGENSTEGETQKTNPEGTGQSQGSESQGSEEVPSGSSQNQDISLGGYQKIDLHDITVPDFVQVDLIEPNMYSRPQKPLTVVNNIVVHYVGNPGTTAENNVSYFKSLSSQSEWDEDSRSASSHFVIGMDGEVIQCVPLYEVAYCSNDRNSDTVSIECCHPDEGGKFTQATYDSLIRLLRYLCLELGLDENDIIRHYDVTGKQCPRYYVVNPEAWEQLKLDLGQALTAGL